MNKKSSRVTIEFYSSMVSTCFLKQFLVFKCTSRMYKTHHQTRLSMNIRQTESIENKVDNQVDIVILENTVEMQNF